MSDAKKLIEDAVPVPHQPGIPAAEAPLFPEMPELTLDSELPLDIGFLARNKEGIPFHISPDDGPLMVTWDEDDEMAFRSRGGNDTPEDLIEKWQDQARELENSTNGMIFTVRDLFAWAESAGLTRPELQ